MSVGLLTSVCVGQNQIPSVVSPLDEGSGIELFQVGPGKKISRREAYQSNIRGLTGELSEARDEKKKAEITKQLESVVGNMFDMDMKGRDAELSKLEARLKKLRERLDRRRQARGEIIQLEVKVLINEAAGLGFSSEGRKGDFGIQFRDFAREHFRKSSALPEATISR
ncbi:MAG TPA: hypothetical protein VHX68_07755 [Planctomycetaceae bacterium]|nr:hypothetical protein [Planctomycetaceae bacterium]